MRAALLALLLAAGGCAAPATDDPPPARTASAKVQVIATVSRMPPAARRALADDLARRHGLAYVAAWALEAIDRDCLVFSVDSAGMEAAMARLRADRAVIGVQTVGVFRTSGVAVRQPNLETINAPRAHRRSTGAGVTVAVVDSAIAADHPDLAVDRITRLDFVENDETETARSGGERHGTAVAGVIGARGRLTGVAPGAHLLGLRACREEVSDDAASAGVCNTVSLARALNSAVLHGADVVNLSLAGPEDPLLAQLVDALAAGGAVIVAATGGPGATFPASHPAALAVGVTQRDAAADIIAPGEDVASLTPGGGYDFFSGASISAAHASGAAALWLEGRARGEAAGAMQALRNSTARELDVCLLVAPRQDCAD